MLDNSKDKEEKEHFVHMTDFLIQNIGLVEASVTEKILSYSKGAWGFCSASYTRLGKELGMSPRTILRIINELKSIELIICENPESLGVTKKYIVNSKLYNMLKGENLNNDEKTKIREKFKVANITKTTTDKLAIPSLENHIPESGVTTFPNEDLSLCSGQNGSGTIDNLSEHPQTISPTNIISEYNSEQNIIDYNNKEDFSFENLKNRLIQTKSTFEGIGAWKTFENYAIIKDVNTDIETITSYLELNKLNTTLHEFLKEPDD